MPTPLEQIKAILPEKIEPVEIPHGSPYISGFNKYRTQLLTLLPEIDQIYKKWFKGEVEKIDFYGWNKETQDLIKSKLIKLNPNQ